MKIELLFFLSIVFTAFVVIIFLLEIRSNHHIANAKKDAHLEGKKCDICFSVYFISPYLKYWRCPLCGSINRQNDYRNRDSSR
jgi:hypothetical protein